MDSSQRLLMTDMYVTVLKGNKFGILFDEVKCFCDWLWWILRISIEYTETRTVGTEEVKCI